MAEVTPIEVLTTLRSSGALTLPTIDDLQAVLPDAAIEVVERHGRAELVVYTGWSLHKDGKTLVPMVDPTDPDQ